MFEVANTTIALIKASQTTRHADLAHHNLTPWVIVCNGFGHFISTSKQVGHHSFKSLFVFEVKVTNV